MRGRLQDDTILRNRSNILVGIFVTSTTHILQSMVLWEMVRHVALLTNHLSHVIMSYDDFTQSVFYFFKWI